MSIQVAVSLGEFPDKLSILEIKAERIQDAAKVANVLAAGGPEMERIPLDAVSATVQPLLAASG
jgi:hypothetical protein